MAERLQAVRGMNDLLPQEMQLMRYIEQTVMSVLAQYGYQQITLPIVEKTALFARGVGEGTDIVEKEMYTFEDRNGETLTLRPEGTAGCVRAMLEHGLIHNQTQKLWYMGPMFRHERPQKGRYRQFYQLGVEVYGIDAPSIDAELLILQYRLWQALKIDKILTLEINTLGSHASRTAYREALVAYCEKHHDQLDEDSQRRLTKNPLRILDSKNPGMRDLIQNAPKIHDYLDDESKVHYEAVKTYCDAAGVPYTENPTLVRGMDYYSHCVFEWTTDQLGAQGTVSAGGRYNQLIEELGGKPTGATGFALGMERLSLLLTAAGVVPNFDAFADVYIVTQGDDQVIAAAFKTAETLRASGFKVLMDAGQSSFKSQFKKADQSGAQLACIIGESECANQQVMLKHLRAEVEQKAVAMENVVAEVRQVLG